MSFFIAFTTFGELILRLLEGIRSIETNKEYDYLFPIFEEVYEEAKKKHPDLEDIEMCIIDKMTVNACSLGKYTVAVSKGAIATFSEDELKAIIAHEIAHIANYDAMARVYITVGNGFFTFVLIMLRLFSFIVRTVQDVAEVSKPAKFFVNVISFLVEAIILIILFLAQATTSIGSRKNEYRADKFAYELGYGNEMLSALYLLEEIQLGDNSNLIQKMVANHPRITKRIYELEEVMEEKVTEYDEYDNEDT